MWVASLVNKVQMARTPAAMSAWRRDSGDSGQAPSLHFRSGPFVSSCPASREAAGCAGAYGLGPAGKAVDQRDAAQATMQAKLKEFPTWAGLPEEERPASCKRTRRLVPPLPFAAWASRQRGHLGAWGSIARHICGASVSPPIRSRADCFAGPHEHILLSAHGAARFSDLL